MPDLIDPDFIKLKRKIKELSSLHKELIRQERWFNFKYSRLKKIRKLLEKKAKIIRYYDSPKVVVEIHKSNILDLNLIT